jgi:ATP-dependent DNA helicase RecQ
VIATRRAELADMRAYVTHTGCRMEYLIRLLDDPVAGPCGQCNNCRGVGLTRELSEELTREAVTFLRRDLRAFEPRKRWAADAVEGLSGTITPRNEPGVALSVYGDAGWGREVEAARHGDGSFRPELVDAAARAILERWQPDPAPAWVTAVPSAGSGFPGRVGRALASALGVRYTAYLSVAANGEPQAAMLNSVQQLRNAHRKLSIDAAEVPPGAVLLVDDFVDSGWTLTVAGWLLQTHGSGPVHPFALADAGQRGG